ncbi:DUF1062 domain-containing protein [Mesorhizobium sp. CAU 1732]|uniref:DUF1062 domain-containing protein n=1 Tax=Mesorhizobium sp. CAU 1732 TaxID=3140358 RepID=UPI00326134A2
MPDFPKGRASAHVGHPHCYLDIVSTTSPVLLLHCSRCDGDRHFTSSGKFRLNANGKKLDAWLVYRCDACDNSWNRSIFERRSRSEIEPALIESLHANDPVLAGRIACDLSGTGLRVSRSETTILRQALAPICKEPEVLVINIALAAGPSGRADRLIAHGLGLSRGEVEALASSGRLVIADAGRKALSRPLRNGIWVTLDVSGRADRSAIAARARGE